MVYGNDITIDYEATNKAILERKRLKRQEILLNNKDFSDDLVDTYHYMLQGKYGGFDRNATLVGGIDLHIIKNLHAEKYNNMEDD